MIIEVLELDTKEKNRYQISGTKCIVGRSKNADVCIPREELSRTHFILEYKNSEFFITDLDSTNGVIVNGDKLPPSMEIPYQPIFPIEIGAVIAISVFTEDQVHEEQKEFESRSSFGPRSETTKTTRITAGIKKQKNPEGSTSGGPSLPLTVLIPLMLVAVGVYYYYSVFNQEDPAQVIQNDHTSVVAPPVDKSFSPPSQDLKKMDFMALRGNGKCFDEKLCKSLQLTRAQETIRFVEGKLIVYVNVGEFELEREASDFAKLSDLQKSEYVLASFGLNPALTNYATEKGVTYLIVVGFSSIEDSILFRSVLGVDYKTLTILTPLMHQNLFGNIFYGGVFRLYRELIQDHVVFSEL